VSKYANSHAYPTFAKLIQSSNGKRSNEEVGKVLTQSLLDVDQEVAKNPSINSQGSTACVVYLNNQEDETSLITANVGDSRAVLSRNKSAIELSVDHKPNSPSEKSRIEALGGKVVWVGEVDKKTGRPIEETGVYRVNGNLALSRALGSLSSPFFLKSVNRRCLFKALRLSLGRYHNHKVCS
jgi:serine/threonine protein phosphatase PrpC